MSDLEGGVRKAACIQATCERSRHGIPGAAPVDPRHPTPLLRGLPDPLRLRLVSLGEMIQRAIEFNQESPQDPPVQVLTWTEMLHRLTVYCGDVEWAEPGGGDHGNRRVPQGSGKPRPRWPPFCRESDPPRGKRGRTFGEER